MLVQSLFFIGVPFFIVVFAWWITKELPSKNRSMPGKILIGIGIILFIVAEIQSWSWPLSLAILLPISIFIIGGIVILVIVLLKS
ncbi:MULTISPECIES: hypothetical protein [Bacillaceae]|uniref:hypothetical protein n=1 Tax=Bacillaceae TaxID=186817 RepID=UPI001BDE1E32|nr:MULTISPECIES: hypothetical protein [Bacillaceae]MDX8360717.1 hypothetical protein [Cytobacillus sp. IB215316]